MNSGKSNTTSDVPLQTSEAATQHWHALSVDDTTAKLQTSANLGLNDEQVRHRRKQYGSNSIAASGRATWLQVLGRQFVDALIWILLAAAVISVAIGETADAVTILAIVLLNGVLGFIQEWKAERAVEALRKMLSPQCQVLRNGEVTQIDAMQIVPGDMVILETGDRVPADLRIVRSTNLRLDESALTGESDSVSKQAAAVSEQAALADRSSMVWMGTAVTNGRGLGAVVAIGAGTQFGRIAGLTEEIVTSTTPLQKKLGTLGRQLGAIAIGISLLITFAGVATGRPWVEMLMTGISLAVAVVPEGLPAVVTITLALGIRAMVQRRALLRRLQAAEALGAATVVCTDKTGTLTQNQMTVQRIWLPGGELEVTGVGYDPAGHFEVQGRVHDYRENPELLALLETGLSCNHALLSHDAGGWHEQGEPTEAALVTAAYKAWLDPDQVHDPVAEFTFSSERKRMTVIVQDGTDRVAHVKGAPEVLLSRCTRLGQGADAQPLDESLQNEIATVCNTMADSGLRTLALARRTLPAAAPLTEEAVEQDLNLLGIVGIIDPPRPEVPQAIRRAQSAGIELVMITGDAARTALAIAHRIGLSADAAIEGSQLTELSDEELLGRLNRDVVFARTAPEHKLRIVKLLQRSGHVVGMTGDGVNDAPALKQADIGIAMGLRGTDVAKGAADIVLTDDNFSSIINAVEEGRRQYDNIQKFVRYMLSSNTGEAVAIFCNILTGGPLILLPVQILWMNLVTDGLTALALGMEPAEKDVMQRPPRNPRHPILDRSAIGMIVGLGTYVGLATLWLFQHYLDSGDPAAAARAQTVAFNGIIVIEFFNVMNFRALRTPLFRVGLLSNPWMLVAIAVTASVQLCAVYVPVMQTALHTVPLQLTDWMLTAAVAAPVLVLAELFKWFRNRSRQITTISE
ncbi:MAG: cation-transporting P-type ATPase, partial [Fuerstiella sp.]